MMHSLLEFVTIFVSFTIFSVVWLIRDGLDDDRSRFILFLGINFLTVGVFDTLHALTFEGMPEVIGIACSHKSTLFWLLARYWLALSLLAAFLLNSILKTSRKATMFYLIINLVAVVGGTAFCLHYTHMIPDLYVAGQGPTELKNSLEYLLIGLHCVILLITWRKSRGIMENVYLNLSYFGIMAIISETTLTTYSEVHHLYNIAGHVLKAVAYCFLFRAVYWSGVINHFYTLGEMAKMNAELLKEDISLEPIIEIQMNKLRKILPIADRIAVYTRKQGNMCQLDYVWGKFSNVLITDWQFDLKAFIEKTGNCITLINQPVQALELFQSDAKDSQIPVEIPIILSKARQMMYIPLAAGGQYYGLISLAIFRRFRRFTANDVEKAKVFQQYSTLTIAQATSQETITRLSFEDSLTGLPNRRFYFSELDSVKEAADRDGKSFTVVYLDMNGLKFVNDTLGHAAGDQALKLIGKQLKQYISRPAFAARLGGDEFAAVFPDLGLADGAAKVEHLRETFAAISLEGYNVTFALAAGGASYPEEATDLEILTKIADDRMYEHKRQLKAKEASEKQKQ
jgi:diguanylate cyclase (GGDEF)-like protein